MPPHCDSLDGPVVTAARTALRKGDVSIVLPYVHAEHEPEVCDTFTRALVAGRLGPAAREVADRWFFETVVRLHRAGEGAPYTGLKPAGLDVGPVVPVAARAAETGDPDELVEVLCRAVHEEVARRLGRIARLAADADRGTAHARAHVEAVLGLQVWANGVHRQLRTDAHAGRGTHVAPVAHGAPDAP